MKRHKTATRIKPKEGRRGFRTEALRVIQTDKPLYYQIPKGKVG